MNREQSLEFAELVKRLDTEGKLLLNVYQLGVKEAEEKLSAKVS